MLKVGKQFTKLLKGVRTFSICKCDVDGCVLDPFESRHCYQPGDQEITDMVGTLGLKSLDELIDLTIPDVIRLKEDWDLGFEGRGEKKSLEEFVERVAKLNNPTLNVMGTGYRDVIVPNVILRNVLENPAWYTPYTPYQAEISQGRLESLLNFQTMIASLSGLPVANSSLLDAGTAAAESMYLAYNKFRQKRKRFLVSKNLHPQTIEVVVSRASPLGVECVVVDESEFKFDDNTFGCIVQFNDTNGDVKSFTEVVDDCHEVDGIAIFAVDLMSLTVLKSPGELGADVVCGDNQNFGIPLNFGGPSAGFMVVQDNVKRIMPGRIIGLSQDIIGRKCLRMALQTREQHIRREKATSNICTACALIANVSTFYGIYHGPDGLIKIAKRIHALTCNLAKGIEKAGHTLLNEGLFFDTIKFKLATPLEDALKIAKEKNVEFRVFEDGSVGCTLNETSDADTVKVLLEIFGGSLDLESMSIIEGNELERTEPFMEENVFQDFRTEHELLRYMYRLETKDLAMTTSMIPLGSCTMKLNSTASMIPMTMPGIVAIHPHTAPENSVGYMNMIRDLEDWLCTITGFDATSLQPNSGAAGEYSGLRCIKAYHESRGDFDRNVFLTPISAHGTNPATIAMSGMDVVVVKCLPGNGAVDLEDLERLAVKHKDNLAGVMITYPSTYGIFEEEILKIFDIVHENGGQVYMDGANMNAQVGFTGPGYMGADVCHLNLHKTFSIPHGGGGPGIGPCCVKEHLIEFLPNHWNYDIGGSASVGQIASSPWGSAAALPITWMYIKMLGNSGLKQATAMAILNANYMVKRLEDHYDILFRGENGFVAHEFILDVNGFKKTCGIMAEDIAKRLMDYGFHAPTLSFPVTNTLMVEPTESESKEELDRFCDAMIAIRGEIREVEEGKYPEDDNVLHGAPHSTAEVCANEWNHVYSREKASFPIERLRYYKFWPTVNRIDNPYGDQNFCGTRPCVLPEFSWHPNE